MKHFKFILFFSLFSSYLFANSDITFTLVCPDDKWVDCGDEIWDLSIYGNAYYTDYSGTHQAGSPQETFYLNTCNTGYIHRKWVVEDQYWNQYTCTQVIYVEGGDFNSNSIDWPEDIELEGCGVSTEPHDLPHASSKPYWTYSECSQIAYSYKDEVFHFGPDCSKLLRTWTLIDWCTYNPNHPGTHGIWEHIQIIKTSNNEMPELLCPSDIKVESYDCDSVYVHIPAPTVTNSTCGGSYHIDHNSIFADVHGADASGTYPLGTHEIVYLVEYGCAYQTTCRITVVVEDASAPVAYCYASIAVALMPMDENGDGVFDDGMVQIWASDINKDSYLPCGYGHLKYSFSPDVDDTFKTFTCAEVGKNTVSMYVTGPNGNYSYCNVTVDVQNNLPNIPNCEPAPEPIAMVQGRVVTPSEEALEDVTMHLDVMDEMTVVETIESIELVETIIDTVYGPNGQILVQFTIDTIYHTVLDTTYNEGLINTIETDKDGLYSFENVAMYTDLQLMPTKASCDLSKITLADAQVLHAFVTGSINFNDPILHLAGDVDDNDVVNFDDLLAIIKLLTGEENQLPCDEPYWFIPEGSSMDNNPFDLPISDPMDVMLEEPISLTYNWIAVLRGDLDKLITPTQLIEIQNNSPLQTLAATSNIEDLVFKDKMIVHPNPVTDITTITMDLTSRSTQRIELRSVTGKLIFSEEHIPSNNRLEVAIDLSKLHSGNYFVTVYSEGKVQQAKVVKL